MIAKQLELVVEKIRQMPEERQAAAIEALEIIAAQDDLALTEAEADGVRLAQRAVQAGRFASEADVKAFFARFRA
jgi:hypothetical protein